MKAATVLLATAVIGFGLVIGINSNSRANESPEMTSCCEGHDKESCTMNDKSCDMKHGEKGGHAMGASHHMDMHGEPKGKVNDKGQASGATMDAVYSGRDLYTCPMHKQVVTDNPEAKCPLCNMNMSKMDEAAAKELRASDPTGCVMGPIVREGDDKNQTCDICNMKLRTIPRPEMKKDDMKHES
ncbi:hypothetical protein KQI63_04335 [bacterium]|nr:hypothetical protein [bacterium]